MADTIIIKSGALGNRETMPKLSRAELGYLTDKKELYIGTSAGNERLCGANDIADINAKIDEIDALITGINGEINGIKELITDITARLDALGNIGE